MGIIERLVHKKKEGVMISASEFDTFDEYICAESAFKISELMYAQPSEFKHIMGIKRGFDNKNVEISADIIIAVSEISKPPLNAKLVDKALQMYKFLKRNSRNSAEKYAMKIQNLDDILNTLTIPSA